MKTGLQNEDFLQRIKVSGSLALKGKNDRGINIFSGSVADDGVISGKLVRPQYNVSELIKSVDVEITELIGRQAPNTGSFVTRSLYEEQLTFNEELSNELESSSLEITRLSSRVEELNATTQSLRVELDGLQVTNETLDRQLSTTQLTYSTASVDLQTAIQNSTQESIQRVSLSARNESLRQEVELLREQLFGRQAQLEAGAQSSGTLFTVNSSPIIKPAEPPIRGSREINKRFLRSNQVKDIVWVNGETITIFNATDEELTVSVSREGDSQWVKRISNKTIEGGGKISFKLELNQSAYNNDSTKDKSGGLIFTGRTSDGAEESVTLSTKLVKWD